MTDRVIDLTTQVRPSAKGARSGSQLQATVVGRLLSVLAEAPTVEEARGQILRSICESLGWDFGAFWELDRDVNLLRCVEVWSPPGGSRPEFETLCSLVTLRAEVGLPGRVWATRQPAWVPQIAEDNNFPLAPFATREGLLGAFAFPIMAGGEFLGVLEFLSTLVREPDPAVSSTIAVIGPPLGEFMSRKKVEEEVEFQRDLLEAQSEAGIEGVLVVDGEGTMTYFNRRFAEMWGIPDEVMESRSDELALHSVLSQVVEPEGYIQRVAYLYEHPGQKSRDEIVLTDGRVFDRYSAPVRSPDGTYYGRVWYFRNVTAQKQTESELRRSRERTAFLAEASKLLATSLDHDTILRKLARLSVPRLADWCSVDVAEEDGTIRQVEVVHEDASKVELPKELERRNPPDPDALLGLGRVLRTGEVELHVSIPEKLVRETAGDAEHAETILSQGLSSAMMVPLTARGRTFGVITFVTAESARCYTAADLELAQELAARAALAADNARLYGERLHIAKTLQRSLLPSTMPAIPGLEVASRYVAAGAAYDVGGDFYDAFDVDGDGWGLLIGDVCGKGVEAAALTALARHTVRTAAMQTRDPRRVLLMLNRALLGNGSGERFCTAAYIRLRRKRNGARVTVACAGHPPALIRRSSGEMQSLGRPGTLLGMFDDPKLIDVATDLDPGDLLVLYTDGVTEARSEDESFGLERLKAVVASCRGLSAGEVVRRVEREALEFQGENARDDIALLAVLVGERA